MGIQSRRLAAARKSSQASAWRPSACSTRPRPISAAAPGSPGAASSPAWLPTSAIAAPASPRAVIARAVAPSQLYRGVLMPASTEIRTAVSPSACASESRPSTR